MEPESALVGADRVVELHPVGTVRADVVVVVEPADAEDDDAVRFGHPFQDRAGRILRMVIQEGDQRPDHFSYRLLKLALAGVPASQPPHKGVEIEIGHSCVSSRSARRHGYFSPVPPRANAAAPVPTSIAHVDRRTRYRRTARRPLPRIARAAANGRGLSPRSATRHSSCPRRSTSAT